MPFYDYSCPACGVFERRGRIEDEETECACGLQATRLCVYQVATVGIARTPLGQREVKIGSFLEASAELEHQHSRQTNIDGSPTPTPPLWQTAKREAKRLMKLGVKASEDLR
ncbi:MAG TPA: zinc ribbon domain-containing protein [Dehalococcoidia bacterium]|nr:zinc ribbon domain-containing protein [Dehalococcoidia bacterium]